MACHRLIPILLLALLTSALVLTPFPGGPDPVGSGVAGAGGGGGAEGPTVNPVKGAPVGQTPGEAQATAAAGQVAAQSPDGSEDDRKRKQLEIYRLAAEIAQLAAEFGQ